MTPSPPRRVGLVVHTGREASFVSASQAIERFRHEDIEVVVAAEGPEPERLGVAVLDHDFAEDLDLALSVGGDGTFLRAAHRCRDAGVPILGVNHGRFGFLTEVEPADLEFALDGVVAGRWTVLPRSTLSMETCDADGTSLGTGWALNEVSIEKSAREHLLQTRIEVSGEPYSEFRSDAVIVATSTGSTAYALSAGGPIVSPHLDVTMVVPVAPHTLYDRTLVVHPREPIHVRIAPDQQPAVVSPDGRTPTMVPAGGAVTCRGSDVPVRVAQVAPVGFPAMLRRRFHLH